MTEIPADNRREAETMAQLVSIARAVFTRYGVDFSAAVRGGGWTNATWLGGGLALRVAVTPGTDHLRREAALGALLPAAAGYPPGIETGVTGGYEWSLSRQIAGENLGKVWPGLDWAQRIQAIRQLWDRVAAVHSVDPAAAAPYVHLDSPLYPADAARSQAGLARLVGLDYLSARQAGALRGIIERFWTLRGRVPQVLNHGDFTIENAIYRDGAVVSLLDFDFALVAPHELDVNELVKMAFLPPEDPDPLPDPGGGGRAQFQQAVIALALPMLDHPGSRDVLLGYAAMLGIWAMENELDHADDRSAGFLARMKGELTGLVDEQGGYLATLLARLEA